MPSPCERAAITSAPSSLRSIPQAAQLQQSFSTWTSASSSAATAGWSLKERRRPSAVSCRAIPKFSPMLIQRSRWVFRFVSFSVHATSSESSRSAAASRCCMAMFGSFHRSCFGLRRSLLVKVNLMSRAELKVEAPPESLPIGAVARLSGKAPSSIRYYEEIGLLEAPERIGGRRRYPPAVLRTLAVIETAQRAGLSLDEIRLLLRATPGDRAATEQLRDVAEDKLPALREAIERAEIVRRWLEDAARCCCPTLDDCPLFEDPVRLP